MVVYSFARALAPEANRFALGFQREAHSGPHFDLPCWPPYQPGQIIFFQTGVPHIVLYTFYVQLASLGGTLGPLKSDLGQFWRFPAIYFVYKKFIKTTLKMSNNKLLFAVRLWKFYYIFRATFIFSPNLLLRFAPPNNHFNKCIYVKNYTIFSWVVNAARRSSRSYCFQVVGWSLHLEQLFLHRFSPKMYNTVEELFCYGSIKVPQSSKFFNRQRTKKI